MITIVTPTLNSAKFIEKNIQSILKLKIKYEHIIVDGGSSDETLDIINKYSHLKIINQKEKLGMYHAIELGFRAANGHIITWVNSDDYIMPDVYEKMYWRIQEDESDLCYSDGKFHYSKNNNYVMMTGKKKPKFLLNQKIMPFIQPCSMYTKTIYDKVGGFDFNNFKIAGDLDFFIKIANNTSKRFSYVKDVSVIFLKYGASLGDKNHILSKKEVNSIKGSSNFITKMLARLIFKLT